MVMEYNITLQRDGGIVHEAKVPAYEMGVVGDYYNGVPYQPSIKDILKVIPHRYRKAVERAQSFWVNGYSSRNVPMRMCLTSAKGEYMGVIYATANFVDKES